MPNDPFRQGVFEQFGLAHDTSLSFQPMNLISRELSLNPRINLVRIIITVRCFAIWTHIGTGNGPLHRRLECYFPFIESIVGIFQKFFYADRAMAAKTRDSGIPISSSLKPCLRSEAPFGEKCSSCVLDSRI
jgi:hypothetical protein